MKNEELADLEQDLADAELALQHDEEALVNAQKWAIESKERRDAAAKRLQNYKTYNQ